MKNKKNQMVKFYLFTMESGKTFYRKMFMDATYEGDSIYKAIAGVSYTVGQGK